MLCEQAASKIMRDNKYHIHTTSLQTNAYILPIWLFYTMSAVYKSD